MFNQDEKWDESFQLRFLYNKITRADGVIIATPEHNHTIIGAVSFHGPVRDGKAWDQLAMAAKRKLYKSVKPIINNR